VRLTSAADRIACSISGSESCLNSDASFDDPPRPAAFSTVDSHICSNRSAVLVGIKLQFWDAELHVLPGLPVG